MTAARGPSPAAVTGRPAPSGIARGAGVVLLVILLACLAVFAVRNLPYAGFWYDEAVQFLLSRGVDAFREPGDPTGGLLDVIRMNGLANLDPGGFSLLLHEWMTVSQQPAWLRALPLAWFLASLAAMGGLAWTWRRSPVFAVAGATVPLAYPLLVYQATELRPYSMELAGIVIGCWLLHRLRAGAAPLCFALAGLTLAAFMSSRYSYTIFVAAAVLALAPELPRGRAGRARLLALGVPLAVGVLGVVLALWTQRPRLTYQGGVHIEYLSVATAAGKSPGWLLRAAVRNLLAPAALPVTLAALVALVPARVRERAGGALLGLGASPEARLMYRLAPGVLLLTAALWRWHPWEIRYKWSLYLHALSAVLVLRMAVDLWDWLVVTASRRGLGRRAEAVGAVLAALVAVGLSFHLTTARRIHGADLTPALGFIEGQPLGPGSVAVGTHAYPVLRYLAEAGPFRGRLPYPTAFRLPSWRGPKPLIGPDTRLMLAYETPAELARLHPGHRFRRDPSWPRHVYLVEPDLPAAAVVPGPVTSRAP